MPHTASNLDTLSTTSQEKNRVAGAISVFIGLGLYAAGLMVAFEVF